ncbi:class I SAM-dependent methyltransferase [Leucobacter albus]|uniref:Class I SAM-dependent methyltransferase n=1 Tax=Leucobacter albus TaxID=272210 RepID=A0ABW3TIE8_9MICO
MNQHYFSESPAGDFTPREIEVELAGRARSVLTAGGVFSPEHLDQGTALLLDTLPGLTELPLVPAGEAADADADADAAAAAATVDHATAAGPAGGGPAVAEAPGAVEAPGTAASAAPILDIGCGWGPIALAAALEHADREVWAIDVNERSRELTRRNAERLGLANVRVASPEDVPAGLEFSELRSNPPIRVGKEVLHGILSEWLPRLVPGGSAYLVVAKHLGADSLQRWIAASFTDFEVDRVARKKGFHVLRAMRD